MPVNDLGAHQFLARRFGANDNDDDNDDADEDDDYDDDDKNIFEGFLAVRMAPQKTF